MKKPTFEQAALQQKVDALVEFVHRGGAPLLDVFEVLEAVSPLMRPNGSTNYEYRFAWNDDCDPDELEIDWKRLKKRIFQRAVKSKDRLKKIEAGATMTAKEKQAYRLELARVDHRYKTAQERLDTNDNCKWIDLSYVEDTQGRRIYIMEVGDAVVSEDEGLDGVIDKYDEIWNWKRGPLTIFGPFRSVEEAEEWMGQKGAFEEA